MFVYMTECLYIFLHFYVPVTMLIWEIAVPPPDEDCVRAELPVPSLPLSEPPGSPPVLLALLFMFYAPSGGLSGNRRKQSNQQGSNVNRDKDSKVGSCGRGPRQCFVGYNITFREGN